MPTLLINWAKPFADVMWLFEKPLPSHEPSQTSAAAAAFVGATNTHAVRSIRTLMHSASARLQVDFVCCFIEIPLSIITHFILPFSAVGCQS